jgi:hypothetical protein
MHFCWLSKSPDGNQTQYHQQNQSCKHMLYFNFQAGKVYLQDDKANVTDYYPKGLEKPYT